MLVVGAAISSGGAVAEVAAVTDRVGAAVAGVVAVVVAVPVAVAVVVAAVVPVNAGVPGRTEMCGRLAVW